jgi:acylphosphatase
MDEQALARLTARVHGQVQGVGYRFFVMEHAAARGLCGFVRNEPGGSVGVVAEGPRGQLDGLLEELQRGPGAAWVREVEALWGTATG